MNIIVNFETAKFLKDVKGFEPESKAFYDGSGELFYYSYSNNVMQRFRYAAPTIAEVVMWLYEKYGIWIECNHCGTFNEFTFKVSKLNKKNRKKEPHYMHDFGKGFNSPTEAYEAAILYCLTNLI